MSNTPETLEALLESARSSLEAYWQIYTLHYGEEVPGSEKARESFREAFKIWKDDLADAEQRRKDRERFATERGGRIVQ